MHKFESSIKPVDLKKAYLGIYDVAQLQKKLDKLFNAYPDIKAVLPDDISAKKLLIGNFKYLVKVYLSFTGYLNGKKPLEKASILSAFVSGGFNYKNHSTKIAKFLMDEKNGFEIHNCVYCDLEDVTIFKKKNGSVVRKFETEHVLDKGECPLLGLSLYNFVPSCGTCNKPDIKGTKTIGSTEAEISKLSPTSEGYDFESNVKFEVTILNPNISDLNATSHIDDYEINLKVSDAIYQISIGLFELKPRYNHRKEKIELLNWREKRRKNPDNIVQEIANLKNVSFGDLFEEMFELNLRRENHYPMEKARRDVMLMPSKS